MRRRLNGLVFNDENYEAFKKLKSQSETPEDKEPDVFELDFTKFFVFGLAGNVNEVLYFNKNFLWMVAVTMMEELWCEIKERNHVNIADPGFFPIFKVKMPKRP